MSNSPEDVARQQLTEERLGRARSFLNREAADNRDTGDLAAMTVMRATGEEAALAIIETDSFVIRGFTEDLVVRPWNLFIGASRPKPHHCRSWTLPNSLRRRPARRPAITRSASPDPKRAKHISAQILSRSQCGAVIPRST